MDEIKLAEIQKGEYFIVQGQIAYVAEVGEAFRTQYDRRDSRLRVIYDNGTESNLRCAPSSARFTATRRGGSSPIPYTGPLFAEVPEEDDLGKWHDLRSP